MLAVCARIMTSRDYIVTAETAVGPVPKRAGSEESGGTARSAHNRRHRRHGESIRDHGGAAGDGREQYRRQVLGRHADDQGREAGRKGGEEERLLPFRTPLWLLPALVRSAGRRRYRQDRGEFQEWRAHGHTA